MIDCVTVFLQLPLANASQTSVLVNGLTDGQNSLSDWLALAQSSMLSMLSNQSERDQSVKPLLQSLLQTVPVDALTGDVLLFSLVVMQQLSVSCSLT